MQARRGTTFASDHLVISALVLSALAGILILAAALTLTGKVPGIGDGNTAELAQPAVANPMTLHPSAGGLDAGIDSADVNINNTGQQLWGLDIGFDAGLVGGQSATESATGRSWGLGVGFDAGLVNDRATKETITGRSWGLGVGFDAGLAPDTVPAPQLPGYGIGPTDY